MPNICVREYHPESGVLIGNISTLQFGRVTSGVSTKVKVIDIAFEGVSYVGKIQLGIISAGGMIVNQNPIEINDDQSSSNGNFGIETSKSFDSSKASKPLSRHFAGINNNADPSSPNNVLIDTRHGDEPISNYIYLDIKVSSTLSGTINGAYKVFFDYS
jgi:hypothetical protein